MSQALYRKYRPQSWADVAGQNHVKIALEFEIASGRVAHAYLFSGPRGVGKTTVARLMAKSLNCLARAKDGARAAEPCGECESCKAIADGAALDVIELDAASHRGVEDVRESIVESARFAPSRLAFKVFIIDEVHMLSDTAFNSLLKTIEEPPPRTVFILATTELHKVPATIISRCQRFDFRKIPFTDLVERLHALAEREKCKVDRRTLEEIARNADGGLRDAEGLLGKVMSIGDGKRVSYDEALVVLPRSDYAALATFVDALLHRDARSALALVGDCLEGGIDLEQFAHDTIELMRKVLLAKLAGDAGVFAPELDDDRRAKIGEWAELAETPRLVRAIETLLEKRQEMKRAHPLQLPLELGVVRICEGITDSKSDGQAAVAAATTARTAKPVATPVAKPVVARVEMAVSKVVEEVTAFVMESAGAPGDSSANAQVEDARASSGELVARTAFAEEVPGDAHRTPDTAPVTTVAALKARWQEIIEKAAEENHALPFLLGVGEPVEVTGATVTIGFDFAFHKDKMNEPKTRTGLEKALGALLGAMVKVNGILLEKKREKVHDDAAALSYSQGVSPNPFNGAAKAGGDSLISAFGGRVVE